MDDQQVEGGWRRFWNRGGLGRAVLLAALYYALYLVASQLVGLLLGDQVDAENVFSSTASVFVGLTLPLIIGSALLVAFVLSVGWFRPLFSRQPIRGSWWMWIAPLVVVGAIVLRLIGIDYAAYGASVVAVTFLTGLFIGFAEEILTRGMAVKILRDAGKSEWTVALYSSLIFAALHAGNIFSGQPIVTVAFTVVYTFAFGICMYLVLRLTGNLIWPMLIHGMFDPTLMLSTGGIDEAHSPTSNLFLDLAAPANFVIMAIGFAALIFIRGHVQRTPSQVAGPVVVHPDDDNRRIQDRLTGKGPSRSSSSKEQ